MKKQIFVLISLLTLSSLAAVEPSSNPDHSAELSKTLLTTETGGYMFLADGSFWQTVPFVVRWRSLSEWWNGKELDVPAEFKTAVKDWVAGSTVEAHPKYGMNIDESNASNQEELKKCTHILINKQTGYALFGISLTPADCMTRLYNEGYSQGYNSGHTKGYTDGLNTSHNTAYQNGYDKGYAKGLTDGKTQGEEIGYARGYQLGVSTQPNQNQHPLVPQLYNDHPEGH